MLLLFAASVLLLFAASVPLTIRVAFAMEATFEWFAAGFVAGHPGIPKNSIFFFFQTDVFQASFIVQDSLAI